MLKAKLNLVSKVIRNPRNVREVTHYLKNDLATLRGVYRYKYPVIFIAGLPKSGTTWLRSMLAMVPGYNIRPVFDPSGALERNDIDEVTFRSLPGNRFSIIKTHTQYSKENFRIITKYADKFIVVIRDLRDMCVSRYFHIKHDRSHPLFQSYNDWDADRGIMHSIEFVHERHVPWIENWRKAAAEHPQNILMIRYEDLNGSLRETLNSVFDFYELDIGEEVVRKMLRTQIRKDADISRNLEDIDNNVGRLKSTARRGVTGDWKNHFTGEHKDRFKALIGEDLIRWGYERDLNW